MELAIKTREKPNTLHQSHELLDELYGKLESAHAQHRAEIAFLKERLRYLANLAFAAKTDHVNISLFNEAELIGELIDNGQAAEEETKSANPPKDRARGKKKPRNIIPDHLPVERRTYELPESEIEAKGLHKIGEEVTKELDYKPGSFKVIEHVTCKYASRSDDELVIQTQRPTPLIPKSVAGPSLLSHIIISKYEHHLPLYRQEQIFCNSGVNLTRDVMANWVIKFGNAIQPLINLLKEMQLEASFLQCDETPYRVLTIDGVEVSKKSYIIVTCDWRPQPIILYHHARGRGSAYIKDVLNDFKGCLQVDGYGGYNWTEEPETGITRVGCLAHIRRKFTAFLKSLPKPNRSNSPAAGIVKLIGDLYKVEEKLRADPTLDRKTIRKEEASATFEELQKLVASELNAVAMSGLYGQALQYADNELVKVKHYLNDSSIEIDNNLCENAIRPFCLGRKNWLFAQTENGGEASANIFSLLMTAKANKLNVSEYLTEIITKLPACKMVDDYADLLPLRKGG